MVYPTQDRTLTVNSSKKIERGRREKVIEFNMIIQFLTTILASVLS